MKNSITSVLCVFVSLGLLFAFIGKSKQQQKLLDDCPEYARAKLAQEEKEQVVKNLCAQKNAILATNQIPYLEKQSKLRYQDIKIEAEMRECQILTNRAQFIIDSIEETSNAR